MRRGNLDDERRRQDSVAPSARVHHRLAARRLPDSPPNFIRQLKEESALPDFCHHIFDGVASPDASEQPHSFRLVSGTENLQQLFVPAAFMLQLFGLPPVRCCVCFRGIGLVVAFVSSTPAMTTCRSLTVALRERDIRLG